MKLGKWLVIASLLGACEVVADFDRDKLDEQRTIGPTPLPTVDGAMPSTPDASRPDGALIGPAPDDAGLDAASAADAAADAAQTADAAGLDSGSEVVTRELDATIE